MAIRRILSATAQVIAGIVFDLLEAAAYFAAVIALTALLSLLLPIIVGFVISLLGVSVYFGYRQARRIERARMRGEYR